MKNSLVLWIVGVLIVVAGAAYWMISNRSSGSLTATGYDTNTAAVMDTTPSESSTASDATSSDKTYSMSDVATHVGQNSCWSVIDGKVYDLTSWIAQHPGGERAILSICGKDGTAVFHGQHAYNQRQAEILVGFKIGTLGLSQ